MKNEKWLDDVSPSMLPPPYDEIARIIGVKNLHKLIEAFGGTTLYISKGKSVFKSVRYQRVLDEFTGYNCQQLALKYDLSEKTIRNIVNEAKS
ncbi:MAG: DNA-binding protein [Clostridiaceae bacterium]|nr:DNA-binding protein [Clostridiaceae bacterium]